ncbi:hypothetical protein [Bathymodiolus thermophilus thioautotrophic gill symbiont]|nr:hypothetical protein [Bathymodiolus thermophilus thioautotrophic gill symbiont]
MVRVRMMGSSGSLALASLSEGGVCHAFNDVALAVGDDVDEVGRRRR